MSQLVDLKKELELVTKNGDLSKLSDSDKKTLLDKVTLIKTMLNEVLKK